MQDKVIKKFLTNLSCGYFLFAPQKEGDISRIKELKDLADIDWSGEIPINSWKEIFFPYYERLFNIEKDKLVEVTRKYPPIACVGMNVLDLKALTLFEQVFSSDSYYQKRRRNMLIIGHSADWPNDYKRYKVFSHKFQEDVLEHLVFDVFLAKMKNGRMKIYSGSKKGQLILEKFGINDFSHVEFAGPISEKGPDKRMLDLKEKMEKSAGKKVWTELDKICIACGKCTIACPTCFCFDIEDKNEPGNESRGRKWGVCFYNDFTLVAGGHKDLDTVKKKIYFWYFHKFVRIPHEYTLPGCVSCGRCSAVCPVGIKINETIKAL